MASTRSNMISQQEGAAPATTHPPPVDAAAPATTHPPPVDATTPSQNRTSVESSGQNTSPTFPSPAKFHVGVNLPSYLSMCTYKFLLSVLSKKPFLVKRKNTQQIGSTGSLTKEGRPFIFLSEMCKTYNLPIFRQSKVAMTDGLLRYVYEDPDRVPDYVRDHFPVGEWLKAKNKDISLAKDIVLLCQDYLGVVVHTDHDNSSSSDDDSIGSTSSRKTTTIDKFPLSLLAVVYHAKKLRLYPESETVFICEREFKADLIDQALSKIDTSPWDKQKIGQEIQVQQRRTSSCVLRLFTLLIVDDVFFDRLLSESAGGPVNRGDLDISAVGDNSNFWVDVCSAFKDDAREMPPIPTHNKFFIDETSHELYDISSCCSKWVTPGKLRKWYNTAHNALVMYRTKYDRSGHHEFNSEEGLTEFVTSFCHGNRDCCFLAVLANWRGDSALEWFCGELPQNVEVVDGFDIPPVVDVQQPSISGSSFASKRARADDETESQISELITSMKRGSNESPEKKEYYKQKQGCWKLLKSVRK